MPEHGQRSDEKQKAARRALEAGDIAGAERSLAEILEENPADHVTLSLMAEFRLLAGDPEQAFKLYTRAVNAAPQVLEYKKRFISLAGLGLQLEYSEALANALIACLKTPGLSTLLESWTGLMLREPRFHSAYGLINRKSYDPSNRAAFANLTEFGPLFTPLFIEGIKANVVGDPVFEEFLTHIRRHLLDDFGDGHARFSPREFAILASALSQYAFLTDYILDADESERERIARLIQNVEASPPSLADGAKIALIACYQPLYGLKNARALLETFQSEHPLCEVVKTQIEDFFALREAAASIPSLTEIDEGVSAKVRELYEAFPYPRWKGLSIENLKGEWQRDECSRRAEGPLRGKEATILVAGCGTGRETAIISAIFPDAKITAIDLSRTSLAYALIKMREHGLKNIDFRHGDILKLGALTERFDYITSTGVLHHMENPIAGWKVLRGLLKSGGLMRIGLYSKAGRTSISKAQAAIRAGNYPATPEGVMRFRREAPKLLDRETLLHLVTVKDYYNTNMYRDLLFHFQEQSFDIGEISAILNQLGLQFEGFNIAPDVLASYRRTFPGDPNARALENWAQFEHAYPRTFASGYSFWCRDKSV